MEFKLVRKVLLNLATLIFKLFRISVPPYPSVSAILARSDKILVIKLPNGKYSLPGGLLNELETFEQGLIREVLEETGLGIEILQKLGEYPCKVNYPTINLAFTAKIINGQLKSSKEGIPQWKSPTEVIEKMEYLDNQFTLTDFIRNIKQI